jgi:hypothetical protein
LDRKKTITILVICRQVLQVSQVIAHEGYNPLTFQNDIACKIKENLLMHKYNQTTKQFDSVLSLLYYILYTISVLKLATAVNLTIYTPICLPDTATDFTGRILC